MDEPPQPVRSDDDARRPWQFSLRALLSAPVGVALFMWFLMAWYPASMWMLPVLIAVLTLTLLCKVSRPESIRGVHILTIVGVCYFMATLAGSAIIWSREDQQTQECSNHLKQIALLLQYYRDDHGRLPPAYVADANGKPMHSWRMLILWYGCFRRTYNEYRFNEPWDSPHNSKLAATMGYFYTCPERRNAVKPGQTSYVAIVGPGKAKPGPASAAQSNQPEEPPEILAIVEVADSGINWMEPRDLDVATLPMAINAKEGMGISSQHCNAGWNRVPRGAHVALADGSVRLLANDATEAEIRALLVLPPSTPQPAR